MPEREKKIPFREVLAALKDDTQPFPPKYLHSFSDLESTHLDKLEKVWSETSESRKINLLQDLEDLSDSETLVCFDETARIGLGDDSPQVRALSARLLWESEDASLIPLFLKMVEKDPDASARAAGASALGRFVLLGEYEEIPEKTLQKVEDSLLRVCTGNDAPSVRQKALEALGFSSRGEVITLIEKALDSGDPHWMVSALFAIGRTADARWEKQVLKYLKSPDDEIRFEAIRAAGELSLASALQPLLEMLESGEEEGDNRLAVIWSLSEIGGDGVREALEESLDQSEDDEEAELIEEALNNLSFTQDMQLADLMELSMDENGSEDQKEDL